MNHCAVPRIVSETSSTVTIDSAMNCPVGTRVVIGGRVYKVIRAIGCTTLTIKRVSWWERLTSWILSRLLGYKMRIRFTDRPR
jgi:hypothetical protein